MSERNGTTRASSSTWFERCLYNVKININSDVREKRAVEGASPYRIEKNDGARPPFFLYKHILVLVSKCKIYLARIYICVYHLYSDRVAHTIFHSVCKVFQAHHIVADIFAVRHIVRVKKSLAGVRKCDKKTELNG